LQAELDCSHVPPKKNARVKRAFMKTENCY
jgi:hypothetical protein